MQASVVLPDFSAVALNLSPLRRAIDPRRKSGFTVQEQAYLDYYRLDLRRKFPGLQQSLGRLSVNNERIATHLFTVPEPRGTVFLVHGYLDHVALYGYAIRFCLQNHLNVVAFDLPGHGLSSGPRVSIDSFDDYSAALKKILETFSHLPKPWYGIGQSTGAAVLLNYLWDAKFAAPAGCFKQTFLLAPLVRPLGWGIQKWAYRLLHKFVKQIGRRFIANTSNDSFNRFLAERDPLQARHIPLPWVGAMKAWIEKCRSLADGSHTEHPLMVLQGNSDITVDRWYNVQEICRIAPGTPVRMFEGVNHHMVNEREEYRRQIFGAIQEQLHASPAIKTE